MPPVVEKALAIGRANVETLFAVANFGASSVFWLALAFLVPAARYGTLMTLQASVFLIVTALTLRTHDLVFFLVGKRGFGVDRAFRTGFVIEITAALVATLICAVASATVYPMPGANVAGAALLGFVAGIGAAQGAAVAKLRYLVRGRTIMFADGACMIAWFSAGAIAYLLRNGPLVTLLVVGALPNAVRTVALLMGERRHHGNPGTCSDASGWAERATIARFLGGAQLTNFLKNGSVSIETMILAAFCPPTSVAMYRLAKSTQGAANAAINVEYQRGFSTLARAETHQQKRIALHRLQRVSMLLCVALYPVSALFALAYALHKPEVGIWSFQLVTLGAFIAFLPAAIQQGYMAVLFQEGTHGIVNHAYVVSVVLLCLFATTLFLWPTIWSFLLATIVAAVARVCFLSVKAAPLLS
ncbi:hypothetical protein [uncultured Sphingomonas sp.]|uniref:hypothetical protein n=1 Tax=uncultured Sphingomonas sp. TaxID=158754 RepID=UPI0030DA643A